MIDLYIDLNNLFPHESTVLAYSSVTKRHSAHVDVVVGTVYPVHTPSLDTFYSCITSLVHQFIRKGPFQLK